MRWARRGPLSDHPPGGPWTCPCPPVHYPRVTLSDVRRPQTPCLRVNIQPTVAQGIRVPPLTLALTRLTLAGVSLSK
jgi:hypothetical protein